MLCVGLGPSDFGLHQCSSDKGWQCELFIVPLWKNVSNGHRQGAVLYVWSGVVVERVWILVAEGRCAEVPSALRSQICPVMGSSEEGDLVPLPSG